MNQELFNLILHALQPTTLAYLVRDLEAYQVDWRYYPENAPPVAVQQKLSQIVETIKTQALALAKTEGLNFLELLEMVREEQRQAEWASQRDRQEQQNWTSDLG
jgi:hypothetical protein